MEGSVRFRELALGKSQWLALDGQLYPIAAQRLCAADLFTERRKVTGMTQFVFRTREQVLEHFVPKVAQRKNKILAVEITDPVLIQTGVDEEDQPIDELIGRGNYIVIEGDTVQVMSSEVFHALYTIIT